MLDGPGAICRGRRTAGLNMDDANELRSEIERLRGVLEEIVEWSATYPLSVFPEPNFEKARQLLAAGGMTLDAISASAMRHVVKGVGEIARKALRRDPRADG
jgi:hypothetical protein